MRPPAQSMVVPLSSGELPHVLPLLLAQPGHAQPVPRSQTAGFLHYLGRADVRWRGWRYGPLTCPTAVALALLLPGRTCILMIAPPGRFGIDPAALAALVAAVQQELRACALHYVQVLLEPDDEDRRQTLAGAGFVALAPLCYFEQDAQRLHVAAVPPPSAQWLAYAPAHHPQFAATVLETYVDTRDCPELSGARPIDDVLASHRGSGTFDAALWELLLVNGRPAACLLLAGVADQLVEIVYMGVVPAWRRQGLGRLLLARAIEHCRARQVPRITVVADERNTPAYQLYERAGFQRVGRRVAYLWPGQTRGVVHTSLAPGSQSVDNL